MEIVMKKIEDLTEYPNNAKVHTQDQIDHICESIEQLGFNDPLGIDENDMILEGHGRFKALKKLGVKKVPCIVIKGLDEVQKKQYIIAHNSLTLSTGFDIELLREDLDFIENEDYEIDFLSIDNLNNEIASMEEDFGEEDTEETIYSTKVVSPVYEMKGEKPLLKDLVDQEEYKEKLKNIEKSGLAKDLKEFLKLACTRFLKFDYRNIAEHYSHLSKEEQEEFENLALVIVDFDKAIENGWVKLNEKMKDLYVQELEGEEDEE